jgi:hypothetical protein
MPDSSLPPDSRRRAGDGIRGRGSNTGTPRWVKVLAIIAIVLVVVVVILMVTGVGSHGPGRHALGGSGGQTALSSVTVDGAKQP